MDPEKPAVDPKATEKNPNTNSAQKKKNKKKKASAATNTEATTQQQPSQNNVINDDYLMMLANQKLNELAIQTSTQKDDAELKRIRTALKTIQKIISDLAEGNNPLKENERIEIVQQFFNEIEEYALRCDEETVAFKKLNNIFRIEKDQAYNENIKLLNMKNKLEQACREMQSTSKQIEANNKMIIEEEEKRRLEIGQNFESTLKEIEGKLEEHEKESKTLDKENEEMREKLKEKLKAYEDREKAFMDQLKEKENELKGNSSKLFDRLKSIESNAKEAMEIKEELEQTSKNETEAKIKLTIYYQKFAEFDDTLNRTHKMLSKFEQEMEKIGSRMKTHHKEKLELDEKSSRTEGAIIKLLDNNNNLKKQIDARKVAKEKIQNICKVLQENLNKINKSIKEKKENK